MADDLERAVLYQLDPTADQATKEAAINYCDNAKASASGWQLCIHHFRSSQRDEMRFWCMSALAEILKKRYHMCVSEDGTAVGFSDSERNTLQQFLMQWVTVDSGSKPNDPNYIRNMVAFVLTLVAKYDYPERWPAFFNSLLSSLQNGHHAIDYFLRVMSCIDEEIVMFNISRSQEEVAHNTLIKDTMRAKCLPDIAEAWYNILNTFEQSNSELCKTTLRVCAKYIGWVDITLFANNKFVPLFYKFLSNEQLREEAAECIYELIEKKMDADKKMMLVRDLGIVDLLRSSQVSEDDFGLWMAKIACTVATMMMTTAETSQNGKEAKEMMDSLIPCLLNYVNTEDYSISQETLSFWTLFVQKLKKMEESVRSQYGSHLQSLLTVVTQRMRFDDDFGFDMDNEDEAEFLQYRKDLNVIFKNISRMCWDMVVMAVLGQLQSVLANAGSLPFGDVELALQLVYIIGESSKESEYVSEQNPLGQMVGMIVQSNISQHNHHIVSLTYFDNIARYAKFFLHHPQYVGAVLTSFLDSRGLRHPHPTVRSRVAFLLLRFLKTLGTNINSHSELILSGIKEHLEVKYVPPTQQVSSAQKVLVFEDQQYLFEVFGMLLGNQEVVAPDIQHQYLEAAIDPLLKQIEALASNTAPPGEETEFQEHITNLIQAIGYISKGVTRPKSKEACDRYVKTTDLFKRALEYILRIPYYYNAEDVISRVLFFLHRMVPTLDVELFPYIASSLPSILSSTRARDVVGAVGLVNQVASKFKKSFTPVLDGLFMAIVQRVYQPAASQRPGSPAVILEPVDEEEREKLELTKTYHVFLNTVMAQDLGSSIMCSPTNMAHVNQIVSSLVEGATSFVDTGVRKTALNTLCRIVEEWYGKGAIPGLEQYIVETALPALVRSFCLPTFDTEDAASLNVLGEFVLFLRKVYQKDNGAADKAWGIFQQLGCTQLQYSELTAEVLAPLANGMYNKQRAQGMLRALFIEARKAMGRG